MVVVPHAFNHRNWEAEAGHRVTVSEYEAQLVYRENYTTVRASQRSHVLKVKNKKR